MAQDVKQIGSDETITEQPGSHQSGVLIGNNVWSTIIGGANNDTLIGDGIETLGMEGRFETFDDTATNYGYASTQPTWLGDWYAPNGYAVLDESVYGLPDSGRGNVLELASNVNASYIREIPDLADGQAIFVQFDYLLPSNGRDLSVLGQEGVEVVWNGDVVISGRPDDFNVWEQFSVRLEGGSGDGTDTLTIRGTGVSDWWAGVIDNVGVFTQDDEHGGWDMLVGNEGDDDLYGGGGRDWLEGGVGADRLFGGEGSDTAFYANAASGVRVHLGKEKGTRGEADGDTYYSIENAHGSDFNDTLIGSNEDNRLIGRNGDDRLVGGNGNDTLLGGAGADRLDGGRGDLDLAEYDWSTSGVDVNLTTGVGTGGYAEGDTLKNIESLSGSYFDDILTGNAVKNRLFGDWGDDVLNGMAGDDVLIGSEGADVMNGGVGSLDVVDYQKSNEAVNVDLANGGSGGYAEGDSYVGVEVVYGSQHSDTIIGDDAVNRLIGFDGDDVLRGMSGNDTLIGGYGADVLDGGEGTADKADYSKADAAVELDLATGGRTGEAAGDSYQSIEFVYGSRFDDDITGDAARNRLVGNEGDDFLSGGANNDTLIGGLGDDTLEGGQGYDVFLMEAAFGSDTIVDFEAGTGMTDRLWFRGLGLSQDDLVVSDTGNGAFIEAANFGTLTLTGVDAAMLSSDDFIF